MQETMHLPGMFMVGSTGRSVGKTEFACSLIREFAADREIFGIKITTINKKDDTCPRGGEGCGVCSSLNGHYCITDEADAPPDKDTARLHSAGAARAFWLRVMRIHMREGLSALLQHLGPNPMLVCESNSLREIVRPGVFVMVKNGKSDACKPSASAVRSLADRLVVFNGREFDFEFSSVHIERGEWTI